MQSGLVSHVRQSAPILRGLTIGLALALVCAVTEVWWLDGGDAIPLMNRMLFALAFGLLFTKCLDTAVIAIASPSRAGLSPGEARWFMGFVYAACFGCGFLIIEPAWTDPTALEGLFLLAAVAMAFGFVMTWVTRPDAARAERLAQFYDIAQPISATRSGRVFLIYGPVVALVASAVAIAVLRPYARDYPIFLAILSFSLFSTFAPTRGRVRANLADLCGILVLMGTVLLF